MADCPACNGTGWAPTENGRVPCRCRGGERFHRLLRAGTPRKLALAERAEPPHPDAERALRAFLEKGVSVYVHRLASGSRAACVALRGATGARLSYRYVYAPSFIADMKEGYQQKIPASELMAPAVDARVLLLDELGEETGRTEWLADLWNRLLYLRGEKATVIVSAIRPEKLPSRYRPYINRIQQRLEDYEVIHV